MPLSRHFGDALPIGSDSGRGTMRRVASITLVGNLALGVVALLCGAPGQVRAASAQQQFDAGTYQAASAKAAEYCTTLWSDHAFDPLRDKIPLLLESSRHLLCL